MEGNNEDVSGANKTVWFAPIEMSQAGVVQGIQAKGGMGDRVEKLGDLVRLVRAQLNVPDVEKWDVSVKGYLEVSTGAFIGGKAGFEATLTLSNKS